jgi:hypothetical protein
MGGRMNRRRRVLQEGRRWNPVVHGPQTEKQQTSPQDFARLGGKERDLRAQKSKYETKKTRTAATPQA